MGKGKNKGQSINRKLKRGVIDLNGSSLKRPFNNSKRNKNSFQLEREKFYFAMKDYLNHIKNKNDNTETD